MRSYLDGTTHRLILTGELDQAIATRLKRS